MLDVSITRSLLSLLRSRKFWLALVTAASALVLYAGGGLEAGELADALVALAGVVIGGIAIEDAAQKRNGGRGRLHS